MIDHLKTALLALGIAACAVDDGAPARDQVPGEIAARPDELLLTTALFAPFIPTDLEDVFDLNNDGKADVCGRAGGGVVCGLGDGSNFGPLVITAPFFSDTSVPSWTAEKYYSTIRFPDLNNDHKADVCGRYSGGIYCGLMVDGNFGPVGRWTADFRDSSDFGNGPQYYGTIAFPDLNNDGMADVCGRSSHGISCALNNGGGFGSLTTWSTLYSDANGWSPTEYYSTIRFPDLNHDGKADVCGRGIGGIWCALSTGTTFAPATLWTGNFSDAFGWNAGPQYFSTIRFPDLNHDGNADICGRAGTGVVCGLNTGSGFGTLTFSAPVFSDSNSWGSDPAYYSTIRYADINGDLKPDVCGRGADGIHCALTGTTTFALDTLWTQGFSNASGFAQAPEYSTIRFPDLNNDHKADICGRAVSGIVCALSTGTKFGNGIQPSPWSQPNDFSNALGWNVGPQYYSTIRFP